MEEESDCERSSSKKKLNYDQKVSLAKELLNFRIVWDTKHPDYFKADCRARAWQQVASRQGLDSATVRAEWKRLRNMYRKRIQRASFNEDTPKWRNSLHLLLRDLFPEGNDEEELPQVATAEREGQDGELPLEEPPEPDEAVDKDSDGEQSKDKLSYRQKVSLTKEISNFRIIWDTNHPEFKKTRIRNEAFKEVASRQGIEPDRVRAEWKRLRDSAYRRRINRAAKGDSKPWFMNSLHILLDQLCPGTAEDGNDTAHQNDEAVEAPEDVMEDDSEESSSSEPLSYKEKLSLAKALLSFRIIWDTTHPDYFKANCRSDAWKQVASRQGLDAYTVRAEWRRLRNMYRKRLQRANEENSRKSKRRDALHPLLQQLFPNTSDGGEGGLLPPVREDGERSAQQSPVPEDDTAMEDSDYEKSPTRKILKYKQRVALAEGMLKYRIIWDSNHPDYNYPFCRANAWKCVASQHGLSVAMVRAEFRRLRDMYRKRIVRASHDDEDILSQPHNKLHTLLVQLFPRSGNVDKEDEDDGAEGSDEERLDQNELQCRLCLHWAPQSESQYFSIISSTLAERIRHCLGIYVTPMDGVRGICCNCEGTVELISEFRALCEQTNEIYESVRIRDDSKEQGKDWKTYSRMVWHGIQLIRRQQELVDRQLGEVKVEGSLESEHLSIKVEPGEVEDLKEEDHEYDSGSEYDDSEQEDEPGEVKQELTENETSANVPGAVVNATKFNELYQMIDGCDETKFPVEETVLNTASADTSQYVPEEGIAEMEDDQDDPAVVDDDFDPMQESSDESTTGLKGKKFDKKRRLEFARACVRYPNLWDVNHPNYKYRLVRDKTWDELAVELRESRSVLRKEWYRLQNVYRARNKRYAMGLNRADDYVMNEPLYQLCRTMMGSSGLVPALRKDGSRSKAGRPLGKPRKKQPDAFDYDQKLKLVQEIEKREPLWNMKHPDHTKPYMSRMWRELGVAMGTTTEAVRHEWRLLGQMHRAKLIRAAKGMSLKNPSSAVDPLNVLLDKLFEDRQIQAEAASSRYTLKPKFDNEGCFPVERDGVTRYNKICELCGKQVERSLFEFHMNQHNGLRPYVCNFEGCGRQYANKIVRDRHEVMIHGQDGFKFECDQCGRKFKQKAPFEYHYAREHKSGPDVTCEICGKVYKHKRLLGYHMRQHNSEPFDCKTCGKRLQTRYSFTVHQRIHTQEKPYPCDLCGERFMLKVQMKTHQTRVHGFSLEMQ